jgi:hypothetical protein
MSLVKRLLVIVGVPALLAGFMMAGSASAAPTVKSGPSLPYTAHFTATVITGGNSFALYSTSCTLTGAGGASHPCFLSGAVSGTPFNYPGIGNDSFTLTGDSFGTVIMHLTQPDEFCANGQATVITSNGPVSASAKATFTPDAIHQTGPDTWTIKGTVKVGPNVSSC